MQGPSDVREADHERQIQSKRWNAAFGEVGIFVVLCRLFAKRHTVEKAAHLAGISPATARRILENVPRLYRLEPPIFKAASGRPHKGALHRPPVTLTDDGTKLFELLESILLRDAAAFPTEVTGHRPTLRVAVSDGPFLRSLLHPLLADSEEANPDGKPLAVALSHRELAKQLQSAKSDKFDAAVIWTELNQVQRMPAHHWNTHVFDQCSFELLLVCRDRELRRRVASCPGFDDPDANKLEWILKWDDLRKAGGRIVYPEQFPAAAGWISSLHLKAAEPVPSVSAVFSKIVAGEAAYGLLPSYYEVLDRFRVMELFHYAKFAPVTRFENRFRVALVTRQGDHGFERLREQIADRLRTCLPISALNQRAKDRELTINTRHYSGTLYSHFVESIATPDRHAVADWRYELLRFDPDGITAGVRSVGGHNLSLGKGRLVNDSRDVFDVKGGVIGKHILYLIADSARDRTTEKMVCDWKELRKFLDELSKRDRVTPSQNSAGTTSFVAFFPYYQEQDGVRVWTGFWLGMNSLYHPLANAMIISNQKLSRAELDEHSRKLRLRFMMAGAGFAGQLAADLNQ
jgi:hypothetical protein